MARLSTICKDLRNIGIMAHIDAGRKPHYGAYSLPGKTHKIGEVHDGAATMDWMVQGGRRGVVLLPPSYHLLLERATSSRSSTPQATLTLPLRLSVLFVFWTVQSSTQLQAFSHSQTVWRQATKYGVPRIAFINKFDPA